MRKYGRYEVRRESNAKVRLTVVIITSDEQRNKSVCVAASKILR